MVDFTVLLVDREPEYADMIERLMSDNGLDIRRACDGENILAEIQKKEIDVVLLDLMIPDTDDIGLLKQIKTMDPMVEVILLANQADLNIAIEGMESGAFGFLFKSVDIDELIYTIQDACRKKALQEEKINNLRNVMGWNE